MSNDYLNRVELALGNHDVKSLIKFWSESYELEDGETVREYISEYVPTLAAFHHVAADANTTFCQFVELYGLECPPELSLSYISYIQWLVSRGDVEALVQIWKTESSSKVRGQIVKAIIFRSLADIAIIYNIHVTEETTFPEFVKVYDEKLYNQKCNQSPDECLVYFAERGDWRGLEAAARGGHLDLMEFFAPRMYGVHSEEDIQAKMALIGLIPAAENGHLDVVKNIVDGDRNGWIKERAIKAAAKAGHLDVVEFLADKGKRLPSIALHFASEGGHLDIVQFLLKNYLHTGHGNANYWNHLLQPAAQSGNKTIIQLVLDKGATDMNRGLLGAAMAGNLELVKFFLQKGATDLESGVLSALLKDQVEIIKFFVEEMNFPLRRVNGIVIYQSYGRRTRAYLRANGIEPAY